MVHSCKVYQTKIKIRCSDGFSSRNHSGLPQPIRKLGNGLCWEIVDWDRNAKKKWLGWDCIKGDDREYEAKVFGDCFGVGIQPKITRLNLKMMLYMIIVYK